MFRRGEFSSLHLIIDVSLYFTIYMTYQQTIHYLFTRLPLFSRIGAAAYKANLDNTIRLCSSLNDPQLQFRSIHVAGTNGKVYKTGLYTSPHLKNFRERIKVNGEMIPEELVIDFTEKIKPLIEEIEPSFFEITVAMAFDHFAKEKVDIAVIETGLGGRLDSTNIITPELSIITNIGWDHMNILGDSLEKIAYEKAGIIKAGVPVVIGEAIPLTKPIFEKIAREKKSPLSFASQKRQVIDWSWKDHMLVTEVAEAHKTDHKIYHLDLPGIYQAKNLLTVLETCSVLKEKEWNITDETIHNALKRVKKLTGLYGRWEVIHINPLVIADVAHNVDGIEQLVQQTEITDHRQLHIIIGMVKDKEVEKVVAILPKGAYYYFTKAQIPRAMPEDELAVKAAQAHLRGETWSEVNDALKAALAKAHPDDMIIVCGSVFLVGEVNTAIL